MAASPDPRAAAASPAAPAPAAVSGAAAGAPAASPLARPPRRFYSEGTAIWYIDRLWPLAAGLPQFDLAIDQVRELDEVTWFSDAWGQRPTCRAVFDHCRRILAADLSYPVILAPPGPPHGGCVLDGIHRIGQALLAGRTTVPAVRLPVMPPPDETLSPEDPRYERQPRDA